MSAEWQGHVHFVGNMDVVPVEDIVEHVFLDEGRCVCQVRWILDRCSGRWVFLHEAADRRAAPAREYLLPLLRRVRRKSVGS